MAGDDIVVGRKVHMHIWTDQSTYMIAHEYDQSTRTRICKDSSLPEVQREICASGRRVDRTYPASATAKQPAHCRSFP